MPQSKPRAPLRRLVQPLAQFLRTEAASGVVLLLCTAAALVLTNSPAGPSFTAFWKQEAGLRLGEWGLTESLAHWVNDGLMVLFFFVVGLEIKRELVAGELREPRQAALPALAALGGMVVPAAIYLALQWDQPGHPGWGIPM